MTGSAWWKTTPLALLLIACLLGTACSGEEPLEPVAATPTPSPSSPTAAEPAPALVDPDEVLRPVAGFRFKRLPQKVRARTRDSFGKLLGEDLYAVAVREVIETREKKQGHKQRKDRGDRRKRAGRRKRSRERRPPPRSVTLIVISVEVPSADLVEDFQKAAVEGLTSDNPGRRISIAGTRAYLSRRVTRKGLHRIFFFYEDTVLVQSFSRSLHTLEKLNTRLLRALRDQPSG